MNLGKHDHSETKLSCIDCKEPICPKCMVQCPVGFRCPQCTDKFTSHILKVDKWVLVKSSLAALIIGFVYGYLNIGGGIGFGSIITYFAGFLLGRLLHRIVSYKLGKKIIITVAVFAFLGIIFSPLGYPVFSFFILCSLPSDPDVKEQAIQAALSLVLPNLVNAFIFIAGLITPFFTRSK